MDIPARPAQTLLAFLLLHPGTNHRREFLAGLLWPESDEESARANLRTWLWQLRKAMDNQQNLIWSDRVSISFNPDVPYWLDVDAVAQPFDISTPRDELEAAVSLYGGELLPGFYDDWVLRERDRVFAAFEQKLQRLLDLLLQEKRWSESITWCERWLALDQVSEPAYRALMKIYAGQGETAKVSAVYKRCKETLKKELDVSPASQTRALFEQLQHSSQVFPRQAGEFAERYRLSQEIGRGGMGIVYKAVDSLLEREVAVKVIHPRNLIHIDLLAEARAVARLSHPNIVTVYDAGELNGKPAIVMELVTGRTLDQWQPHTWEEIFDLATQLTNALVEAHEQGIIHRDIKPQNIFVQTGRTLTFKLVDFGLAHWHTAPRQLKESFSGTVAYAAPEQIQKNKSDSRTDLYALGVVLYEVITGGLPFIADEPKDLLWQHVNEPVTPPNQFHPEIPPQALNDVLLKLLEKEPDDRYQNAVQLAEALAHARQISAPAPIWPQPATVPNNLPYQVSSFIGREQEMKQVKELLATSRLVTLTGSGGTGKTRLSLEVATEVMDSFPDGVWFLDLPPVTDPTLVPYTLANLLGLRESANTKQSIAELVSGYFHSRKALVILDNCEHLIESCAGFAHQLLRSCKDLRILASSREPLGVEGEMAWHVPSLSLPDDNELLTIEQLSQYEAVRLFIERATPVQPHFTVTNEDAPTLAQICIRLDGIPLAIELAAARVNVLTMEQIANRLDDRFRLLTGGARTALPRQQTLRATIDWSYNLLSDEERLLFRRLAVFIGGWSLEAAEAICSGEGIESHLVLDLLSQLVKKSLVTMEEEHGESRYHRLETIRQYAREKLFETDEAARVRDIHLDYYIQLAEQGYEELYGPNDLVWIEKLDSEHDNFRAALGWSFESPNVDPQKALQLSGALQDFWDTRGLASEGFQWLSKALKKVTDAPTPQRCRALVGAGLLGIRTSQGKEGPLYVENALHLARQLNSPPLIIRSLLYSWNVFGDQVENRKRLEECIELARKTQNLYYLAYSLAGWSDEYSDNAPDAFRTIEEAYAIAEKLGNARLRGIVHWIYGGIEMRRASYDSAKSLLQESLRLSQLLKDKHSTAHCFLMLGRLATGQAYYDDAIRYEEESLQMFRDLSDYVCTARTLRWLGWNAYLSGKTRQAMEQIEEGLFTFREIEVPYESVISLVFLGRVFAAQGDIQKAKGLYLEALELMKKSPEWTDILVYSLEGVCALPGIVLEQATRLMGKAEAIRERLAFVVPTSERDLVDSILENYNRDLEKSFSNPHALPG